MSKVKDLLIDVIIACGVSIPLMFLAHGRNEEIIWYSGWISFIFYDGIKNLIKKREVVKLQRANFNKSIDELKEECDMYIRALKDIRDNYDHDSDAHKYNTSCRCCTAEKVLNNRKG